MGRVVTTDMSKALVHAAVRQIKAVYESRDFPMENARQIENTEDTEA
jgi:hypothetical protein